MRQPSSVVGIVGTACVVAACGVVFACASAPAPDDAAGAPGAKGGTSGDGNGDPGAGSGGGGGGGTSGNGGTTSSGGGGGTSNGGIAPTAGSPMLGGCPMLPTTNVFNTPIDTMPPHPNSAAFMKTIGAHNLHPDFGAQTDQTKDDFYGIPYNLVHGNALTWAPARFSSTDSDMDWDPTDEADCASNADHTKVIAPCTVGAAPSPVFPIPANPLVEGGIDTDPDQPYGDHHILIVDQDTCRLWETYHSYPKAGGGAGWDIFGAATFDLKSNALRPDEWTSADAAGFPILPLLARAAEANTGTIAHALRMTIDTHHIRTSYVWPGRHLTTLGTDSEDLPPMGQAFRINRDYVIPANFTTQARAILQAMKTYGMYLADGGSDMYFTGDPDASWTDDTIDQLKSVSNAVVEAVDLSSIAKRAGFDKDSGAVPAP